MSYTKPMLEAYPRDFNVDADVLARCIDACYECAQACSACADGCLTPPGDGRRLKMGAGAPLLGQPARRQRRRRGGDVVRRPETAVLDCLLAVSCDCGRVAMGSAPQSSACQLSRRHGACAVGQAPQALEDSEYVDSSLAEEFHRVVDHIKRPSHV